MLAVPVVRYLLIVVVELRILLAVLAASLSMVLGDRNSPRPHNQ
jgi:hypothetical protein